MKTVKDMLCALHEAGVKDHVIVRATQIPQPTICKLRRGNLRDTSYVKGKRIENFYALFFPAGQNPS